MKNIIVSDIHSNIEALLALIKELSIKEVPIDRLLVAGDVVGYGASPNECCDIIRYLVYGEKAMPLETIHNKILNQPYLDFSGRDTMMNALALFEKKCFVIGGNHDKEAIGEPSLVSEMNPVAKAAADWTHEKLTKENRRFLKNLSMRKKFGKEGFEIVHSTPAYPRGYEYAKNAGVLKYTSLWSKATFGGHTHRPAAYIYTKETRMVNATVLIPTDNYDMRLMLIEKQSNDKEESFTMDSDKDWKYYLNVGSLGQPRDGNPYGSYVVFDSVSKHVSFKRVPYNTEAASEKIKRAELPKELAERILKGV
ncbi:MAG: metallophosphoesterase [Candidatus Brocadiaceae bacterium]|nr:metallophosphoesterase [Candidatus Brocadiaceae bacterium]